MLKKFCAAVAISASLAAGAAFASDAPVPDDRLLEEYISVLERIEMERMALEDERFWMEEARQKKEIDDKLYEHYTALLDKATERLDRERAKLDKERRVFEAQRAEMLKTERTPVRRVRPGHPLIRQHIARKMYRYWWAFQ